MTRTQSTPHHTALVGAPHHDGGRARTQEARVQGKGIYKDCTFIVSPVSRSSKEFALLAAGRGPGKTRMMQQRIEYCLEHGLPYPGLGPGQGGYESKPMHDGHGSASVHSQAEVDQSLRMSGLQPHGSPLDDNLRAFQTLYKRRHTMCPNDIAALNRLAHSKAQVVAGDLDPEVLDALTGQGVLLGSPYVVVTEGGRVEDPILPSEVDGMYVEQPKQFGPNPAYSSLQPTEPMRHIEDVPNTNHDSYAAAVAACDDKPGTVHTYPTGRHAHRCGHEDKHRHRCTLTVNHECPCEFHTPVPRQAISILSRQVGKTHTQAVVEAVRAAQEAGLRSTLLDYLRWKKGQETLLHACTTGDCHHAYQAECNEALVDLYITMKGKQECSWCGEHHKGGPENCDKGEPKCLNS